MKKMIAILMSVICTLSMVGCGKKTEEKLQQEVEDKTEVTFEGKNMEFEGINGTILYHTVNSGKIYMLTGSKANSEENQENIYQLYCSDIDGNGTELISSSFSAGKNVVSFCVDTTGNIMCLLTSGNNEEQIIELVKIDKQGKELLKKDITNCVKRNSDLISEMAVDKNGQIILACGENVLFFDEQLQSTGEVATQNGYVVDIALAMTGEIVCATEQLNSDVMDIKVYLLNTESKQWGDIVNIRLGESGERDYVIDGLEYDFYYKEDTGIYGYNIETKTKTELINYDASYMTSTDAEGIICADKSMFIGKSEDFVDGKRETTLVAYVKKNMTAENEKEVITYGTFYASADIKNAIAKFNRGNSEYEIIIQEYRDMDENRLLTDIATGNGQDIIDLRFFPFSVEQCISKELIEDLTPYYEKDLALDTSDIIDSVREAMEYDGKLYYVTPSFSMTTMAAKTEFVGNHMGWTVADLKDLMKKKDVNLFSIEDTKDAYLWQFIYYNISDYVDWESGICDFDSEEFKYILELCNEKGKKEEVNISETEIYEEVDSMYSRLRDGKYILLAEDTVSLQTVQLERKAVGVDVTYIGFPNKEKKGSYFRFDNQFAISSQSKVKEQAWSFIRYFMTEEYQKTINCDCCMPIRQDMFDNRIKALTATETYIDEFGETIEPIEEYTLEWGDAEIEMAVPTQEDVDVYLHLINETKRCVDSDSIILDIIFEEAEEYFNGKMDLDKTADVIQKRVETYINEQKK